PRRGHGRRRHRCRWRGSRPRRRGGTDGGNRSRARVPGVRRRRSLRGGMDARKRCKQPLRGGAGGSRQLPRGSLEVAQRCALSYSRRDSGLEQSKMITKEFAQSFAHEWIEAWNSHDLDQILSHYADDFVMSSPRIATIAGEPSGVLRGKGPIGAYWKRAL